MGQSRGLGRDKGGHAEALQRTLEERLGVDEVLRVSARRRLRLGLWWEGILYGPHPYPLQHRGTTIAAPRAGRSWTGERKCPALISCCHDGRSRGCWGSKQDEAETYAVVRP